MQPREGYVLRWRGGFGRMDKGGFLNTLRIASFQSFSGSLRRSGSGPGFSCCLLITES